MMTSVSFAIAFMCPPTSRFAFVFDLAIEIRDTQAAWRRCWPALTAPGPHHQLTMAHSGQATAAINPTSDQAGGKSASAWLLRRKPGLLAVVALANKMARIVWPGCRVGKRTGA